MDNYTVIHGNVIYKVENVQYNVTDTHRVFSRDSKRVLSVPLSSVLVRDNAGVTARVVNGLTTGVGFNTPDNKTTIVQSDDNFVEGMIVGGIVGAVLF